MDIVDVGVDSLMKVKGLAEIRVNFFRIKSNIARKTGPGPDQDFTSRGHQSQLFGFAPFDQGLVEIS